MQQVVSKHNAVNVRPFRSNRHGQACLVCLSKKTQAEGAKPLKLAKRKKQKGGIRLFLDTADVEQWELWAPTGTLYGFTTNPAILEKDGVPCTLEAIKGLASTARMLAAKELQAQAWGATAEQLETVALQLLEIDPDLITVKLPCTPAGLQAAATVMAKADDCRITMTGVYEDFQVLACMGVGADYMAPYFGRMMDLWAPKPSMFSEDYGDLTPYGKAMEAVTSMVKSVRSSDSDMRVLVASIRDPAHMAELAAQGCNTFTFSPAIMAKLCKVPATMEAALDFEAAAARNGVNQEAPLASAQNGTPSPE